MSITRWFTQPLEVLRAPEVVDGHGARRRDWNAAEVVDTTRGRVAQMSTEEQLEQRDQTVTGYHLRAPADFDVLAGDRVRCEGKLYTVDGDPNRARGRRRVHHVHAILRRVGVA